MGKALDLLHKKLGRLTVLKKLGRIREYKTGKDKAIYWLCQCECGNLVELPTHRFSKDYRLQCEACGYGSKPFKEELSWQFWNIILRTCKKRNIPITVTKDQAYNLFLSQERKCSLSGILIDFPKNTKDISTYNYAASLDRINSSKEYCLENIQWIHKDINKMKNTFTEEYLLKLCLLINNNLNNKQKSVILTYTGPNRDFNYGFKFSNK